MEKISSANENKDKLNQIIADFAAIESDYATQHSAIHDLLLEGCIKCARLAELIYNCAKAMTYQIKHYYEPSRKDDDVTVPSTDITKIINNLNRFATAISSSLTECLGEIEEFNNKYLK